MVAALSPVGSPTGLLLYVTGIDQIIQRPAYRAHGQLCVPVDRSDGGETFPFPVCTAAQIHVYRHNDAGSAFNVTARLGSSSAQIVSNQPLTRSPASAPASAAPGTAPAPVQSAAPAGYRTLSVSSPLFLYRFIYRQPRGNRSAGLLHQHFLYPVICISSSDTICLVTFI